MIIIDQYHAIKCNCKHFIEKKRSQEWIENSRLFFYIHEKCIMIKYELRKLENINICIQKYITANYFTCAFYLSFI
jgi:hypothetical protein